MPVFLSCYSSEFSALQDQSLSYLYPILSSEDQKRSHISQLNTTIWNFVCERKGQILTFSFVLLLSHS